MQQNIGFIRKTSLILSTAVILQGGWISASEHVTVNCGAKYVLVSNYLEEIELSGFSAMKVDPETGQSNSNISFNERTQVHVTVKSGVYKNPSMYSSEAPSIQAQIEGLEIEQRVDLRSGKISTVPVQKLLASLFFPIPSEGQTVRQFLNLEREEITIHRSAEEGYRRVRGLILTCSVSK